MLALVGFGAKAGVVPLHVWLPKAHPRRAASPESPLAAFGSKWANLGGLAIFLYVGAEVSVMSGMIFFLEETQIMNLPSQVAGFVGPLFMLFAMFGRFIGSWLMTFVKATTMLTVVALGAAIQQSLLVDLVVDPHQPRVFVHCGRGRRRQLICVAVC